MKKTRFTVYGDDSVEIRYPDGEVRFYRTRGGYVYELEGQPHQGHGTRQVLDPRGPRGTTLTGPRDGMALAALLRDRLEVARRKYAKNTGLDITRPRERAAILEEVKL